MLSAATGEPADAERILTVKAAVPGTPVLVASGLTPRNAPALFPASDGAIVGTSVKRDQDPNAPVDLARARRLFTVCRKNG